MSESVSAAIHIRGTTLSYAEIEHRESSQHLRRVNRHTFDFDVLEALKEASEGAETLDRLAEGVRRELGESEASTVKVAIHPLEGFSFFTPLPTKLSVQKRKQELLQQAALVTGARSARSFHLASRTVRTVPDSDGESLMWIHVLAIPEEVDRRVAAWVEGTPVRSHSWMVSAEAAARLVGRIERTRPSHEEALHPYSLAIGEYPDHTEYALSRNREWYHAHYTLAADNPDDRAYYAVAFLNRIDVDVGAIGRLFLYGPSVDLNAYASLESLFGPQPEHLDPLYAVQRGEGVASDVDVGSHVLSIGAAMTPYVE